MTTKADLLAGFWTRCLSTSHLWVSGWCFRVAAGLIKTKTTGSWKENYCLVWTLRKHILHVSTVIVYTILFITSNIFILQLSYSVTAANFDFYLKLKQRLTLPKLCRSPRKISAIYVKQNFPQLKMLSRTLPMHAVKPRLNDLTLLYNIC